MASWSNDKHTSKQEARSFNARGFNSKLLYWCRWRGLIPLKESESFKLLFAVKVEKKNTSRDILEKKKEI